MAEDRWYEQIESQIYTLVSHRIRNALYGKTSKTIKFTSVGENEGLPYFPTCYLHELEPGEFGGDLHGTSINAVLETFECVVFSRDKKETSLILNECVHQMKRLGFTVTAMPIISTDDNVHNGVARFRRVIGADDVFT